MSEIYGNLMQLSICKDGHIQAVCCDLEQCLENDFHCACLRTELFLKIFLLSNPLNQNPKTITVNPFFTATLSSLISQSFEMFNKYFRKHYLYLLKIVNKICCLRPTRA